MVGAMMNNAGLISAINLFAVFGYALLEESRPRKDFWNFMYKYTFVLIFLKFTWNLGILEEALTNPEFNKNYFVGMSGLRVYNRFWDLYNYFIPEFFIIYFIFMNKIKL